MLYINEEKVSSENQKKLPKEIILEIENRLNKKIRINPEILKDTIKINDNFDKIILQLMLLLKLYS